MSSNLDQQDTKDNTQAGAEEEHPQNLRKEVWLSIILFAALIVGLSVCAPTWLFN